MVDVLYSFRSATTAEWLLANPLVPVGVPCFEVDSGRLKIGDGSSLYAELDYFTGVVVLPVIFDDSGPRLDATYTSQKIESDIAAVLDASKIYADGLLLNGNPRYPVSAAQQLSDGTWPNRPNCDVAMALGYPGRTDPPGWLVSPSDIYFMKSS